MMNRLTSCADLKHGRHATREQCFEVNVDVSRTIFMTGATGFLGHYAVRNLLQSGHRLVVMLRSPLSESTERLTTLLEGIGLDAAACVAGGQLVPVAGELPDHLPECAWGTTDAILHCAANLQLLTNGSDEPYATNVSGTDAVIDWAERHGITEIHAVSTAYTCGWNKGRIAEVFHESQPDFQTDYERSKWTSETHLCKWAGRADRSLTVYRPSFLVGDSTTGYTTQYGGFYQFAWLISLLKQRYFDPDNGDITHVPLRIPGRAEDPQNIVPVDFVSRMMAEVMSRPEYHGRIYHLTNPDPPTNGFLKTCCEEYFGLRGGYFVDPEDVNGDPSGAESLLWGQYHLLKPRMTHNPLFDTTNTRRAMQAATVDFPTLNRERVFNLFDYAAAKQWGRGSSGNGFKS